MITMCDRHDPMDDANEDNYRAMCDNSTGHQPESTEEIVRETSIIDNAANAKFIVQHLLDLHKVVALDCRGRNFNCEPPEAKICLVAVATCNGKCIIFDLHLCPQIMTGGRLKKLLESYQITKVMHNCSSISLCLFTCFGVKLHNVFDTQCAHSILEYQRTRMDWKCVPTESLSFISNMYGRCLPNPAKHAMKRLYHDDECFWEARPVGVKLKEYIARDVMCLVPEAYDNLRRAIPCPLMHAFTDFCDSRIIELVDDDLFEKQKCQRKIKKYQRCIEILEEKIQRSSSAVGGMDDDSSSVGNTTCSDASCNTRNQRPKKKPCSTGNNKKIRQCSSAHTPRGNRTCQNERVSQTKSARVCNQKCCEVRECCQPKFTSRCRANPCDQLTSAGNRKRKLTHTISSRSCCHSSCPKKKTCQKCGCKSDVKKMDKNCACRNINAKKCLSKNNSCTRNQSSKSIVSVHWNDVGDSDSEDDAEREMENMDCDVQNDSDQCNDEQEEEDESDGQADCGGGKRCYCDNCTTDRNDGGKDCEEGDVDCNGDENCDENEESEECSSEEQSESEHDCSGTKKRRKA